MAPVDLNLVIPQGTTFQKTVVLRHGLRLARDLNPNTAIPPTSITIEPLPFDLPAGYELSFPLTGCNTIDLVTAAIVGAGAKTIPIQPYTEQFSLVCGKIANTLPINITGEIWRGSCRKKYADPVSILNWAFTYSPLSGQVTGTISATDTSAIEIAERERIVFSDIPSDYQSEKNFKPEVWSKAWFYDWERVFPSGKVDRVFQGRLWMTSEATK